MKLLVAQLVKKFLAFYKTHRFVHKSLPLDSIQSQLNLVHISHPISLRFVLILFSYLSLYLPSGLFS
jgi:hypothetical protein